MKRPDSLYGTIEFFRFYNQRYSENQQNVKTAVGYKTYSNIIYDFNKELSRLLIEENVEFKMPLRLGTLRIRKYKRKIRYNEDGTLKKNRLVVNWNQTLKLWAKIYPGLNKTELKAIKNKQVVYHLNEHTDGFSLMLYWYKRACNAINKNVFSVHLTRTNDRYMAKVVKTNKSVNYYE